MNRRRFLAMLCALSLLCMDLTCALPAMAADSSDAQAVSAEEAKAEEEAAAKKKAEEEAAAKKAEEEAAAAKKAEEEAAAAKKAEEEAAAKKAEEEAAAAKKAEEEAAAAKKAEEEAAAAKKAEEEAAAAKKAEEEAAAKKAEEEAAAAKKAEEEAAAAKKAEEEATPAPTEPPTPAPTEPPTPAPTEPPTPAPTEPPTPAPTEPPTPAPTEPPTPAPTEPPTLAPTEEPTAEPTATPVPGVELSNLRASRDRVSPGKNIKIRFKVKNAEEVTWSVRRSDGMNGGSGRAEGSSFTWKSDVTGIYTVKVTAKGGGKKASQTCTVTVRGSKLEAVAEASTGYAQVGGQKLSYDLQIKGGCEPYRVSVVIKYKDRKIFKSKVFEPLVVCDAEGFGKHTLIFEVKDAEGNTARAKSVIVAATNEKNDAPRLPGLGRDMTFAERLVAVAESQIGYRESEENFVYRDDGSVQGWSFYGGWYGMPYEEWCAMFVCYCLQSAGIGEGLMPRSANCNRWKNALGRRYIDDEDAYVPEAGDLIFFHHDRVSRDPNFPNHIGIVTGFDAEKGIVYTVEGNSGKSVRTHQYAREDAVIVGYASMRACMRRWDPVFRARLDDALARDLRRIKGAGRAPKHGK